MSRRDVRRAARGIRGTSRAICAVTDTEPAAAGIPSRLRVLGVLGALRDQPMPSGRVAVLVWTYAAVAAVLLLAVTMAVPVSSRIALPFAVGGISSVTLGVMVWVLVGVATSTRGTTDEGRAAIIFGVAPVVAVMSLGGPTAAVWVALLGSLELREIRGDVPWYGVLANHAMLVIPAAAGGFVTLGLRTLLPTADGELLDFVMVMAGAAVFCAGNSALALLAVWARTGRGPLDALGIRPRSVAVMMAAESALGWLFAAAYLSIAWWSPAVLVVADAAAARSVDRGRADWLLRHHPLTELPNRLSLDEHAQDLRRLRRQGACAFYIDLDGFKLVNDDYDHDVGDEVLKIVAQRLAATKRHDDFLAHLHGDEFVILASGVEAEEEAEGIVERIIRVVERPIEIRTGIISISASVGFRLAPDLTRLDEVLRAADRGMTVAKRARAIAAGRVRRTV